MPGDPEVERQFREVDSYNLFYSIMTARAEPCLAQRGWFCPIQFGKISDPFADVTVYPDFVLYDGDICLLVELKSGNNITSRDIRQMSRCNELTIDGVERELRDADVRAKTPYNGEVSTIDSCIIYQDMSEEWLDDCLNEWESCRQSLEQLEQETAVLTQDFGGTLRRLTGEFESNRLQRLFTEGIQLPLNPKEEFMLTEAMEMEVLVVAICDIWGEQALSHDMPIQTNVNEVRNFFSPPFNVPPEKVNRALFYLTKIGACRHVNNLTYEFSKDHVSEILSIKRTVFEERVEYTLAEVGDDEIPDEHQATFDMAFEESQETADGGASSPATDDESVE